MIGVCFYVCVFVCVCAVYVDVRENTHKKETSRKTANNETRRRFYFHLFLLLLLLLYLFQIREQLLICLCHYHVNDDAKRLALGLPFHFTIFAYHSICV